MKFVIFPKKNDQIFIRDICKTTNLFYKDALKNNNNINNLNNIHKEISNEIFNLFSTNNKMFKMIHFLINEILS